MFNITLKRKGTNSIKWDQYKDHDIISMSTADMDFLSPPCVKEALLKRADLGIYAYELISESYYNAVVEWFVNKYQWQIKKEWLCHSPGIWTGVRICIDTFTKPMDKVLVQAPMFHPIAEIIEKSNRTLVINHLKLEEGKCSIDFQDFENKIADQVKLFVLVNPQNPTGRVFTLGELQRIGEICRKYNVIVLSDEVHGGIVYDTHRHIPFLKVEKGFEENAIVITAASKSFNLQGLTHGILVIPNERLKALYLSSLKGYDLDFATNVFSLAGVESAYRCGGPWLETLNDYLQENLNFLMAYFSNHIPLIKVVKPEGAYTAWLDCRDLNLNSTELETLFMDKAKVAVTFGHKFGLDYERFARINFACTLYTLKLALGRIEHAVDSLK